MNDAPVAFLSYVRFDDEHDNGRLTQFRERLSREVRIQTGQSFEIFQDRKDIAWGEQWLPRIEGTLQSVTFFIPLITPTFFASVACRDELALFLEHEARLRRNDLILPVYYVECARLSDKEQRTEDPLAQALAERQFFDWRAYRFEPFTTPAVGKSFESMARQIRDALGRAPRSPRPNESPRGSVAGSGPTSWTERLKQSALEATGLASRGASSEGQAPVLIVDALHRGHYPTIGQAIQAAKPGSRIMVRPGLYREGVVIDKPLELIGEGDRADIVIEASGKAAILFQ
ncbi:MAG: TIR domain-containing protein, partial [Cyanobacteriota bacterium]